VDASARRMGRGRTLLLLLVLVVGIAGVGLAARSGVRLYRRLVVGPPVAVRQADVSQVAGWMTAPYVARTYGVPGEVIFAALDVPSEENRRRSLDAIADRYGRDREELLVTVRSTVAGQRPTVPPPSRPGGRPSPGPAP
jgi:hypothetical protein